MHTKHGTRQVLGVMLYSSLTALAACLLAGTPTEAFRGLLAILRAPAQLTTDAFLLGGLSGTFLNAGIVGLCCTGVMAVSRARLSGVSLMAFFLTLGFSFFGINAMNIWPCILGTWLYARIDRVAFAAQVNTAFFAASLSPFVSEMLWRYPLLTGLPAEPLLRILAALLTGGLAGFLMPILCRHSPNLHKGYSLYNAATVAGYIGVMLYAVLYHAMDVPPPSSVSLGEPHPYAVTLFMVVLCTGFVIAGFVMNGRSFHGYGKLFFCSGYRCDFTRTLGMPLTLIHIGVFGLMATMYACLIEAPMNGPTLGSIICLLAIAPCGGHLLNVLPILAGYGLASVMFHFQLSTQSIVVGFSFACALCQIAGHFGALCGVAAGFLHACLVTTVVGIHGGFCLYNGGFTSGICAILLVPVLETFFMPMDRLHLIPRWLKRSQRQEHTNRQEHQRHS